MCHRPQWRRPYRSTLNPLKARSYSTPGLATTSRSASLGRQARGCCRLHHGRFALSWSRGQSHSALKSLGVLMASMDRKSNLRRDDPSSCLNERWVGRCPALAGFCGLRSDIAPSPRSARRRHRHSALPIFLTAGVSSPTRAHAVKHPRAFPRSSPLATIYGAHGVHAEDARAATIEMKETWTLGSYAIGYREDNIMIRAVTTTVALLAAGLAAIQLAPRPSARPARAGSR